MKKKLVRNHKKMGKYKITPVFGLIFRRKIM
ncbi:MAG: hypothetical protein ACI9AV_002135, partial [Sediminicola sp.]